MSGRTKTSEVRQRLAIERYASSAGYQIVQFFRDPAVSGTDAIETRPGFSSLLDLVESNGVRVVLVEDASRLARSVVVQEVGVMALQARDVRVLTCNGDDLTASDDEMKVALRQICAVFAQLEKTRLVKKLAAARARKRATGVKVEGRPSHAQLAPEAVAMARRLRRKKPKGGQLSLRAISAELAAGGYLNERGLPYNAKSVASMLATSPAKSKPVETDPETTEEWPDEGEILNALRRQNAAR